MKDTEDTPPGAVRHREKWRFCGRKPIIGLPDDDFYWWEQTNTPRGRLYPRQYAMPVEQFWTQR